MNPRVLLLVLVTVGIIGLFVVMNKQAEREHSTVVAQPAPEAPAPAPAAVAPPQTIPVDPAALGMVQPPPPGPRTRANGPAAPDLSNPATRFVELMTYDLRGLTMVEEVYYAENATYTSDVSKLRDFRTQPGVTIDISGAGQTGWAAVAHHAGDPKKRCAVFVGAVSPPSPATEQGRVACQ